MDLMTGLVAAGWVAILLVLVAGIVNAWRRVFSSDAPLPFFSRVEARGQTLAGIEEAIGLDGLVGAVRRCALCRERPQCEHGAAVDCPNEGILRRAAR